MKITLIGAAGVRTPLLVHGLAGAGENMRLEELAFWDIDRERLAVVGRVAEAMARRSGLRARLRFFRDLDRAVEGADYVITSIRVGGMDARVKDETIAFAHVLVGEETVVVGGGGRAMRSRSASLEYAPSFGRVCVGMT